MLRKLLSLKDLDINSTDNNNETALHVAVNKNSVQCARILIEHEAETDLQNFEPKHYNPYERVFLSENLEMAKLLLESGPYLLKDSILFVEQFPSGER